MAQVTPGELRLRTFGAPALTNEHGHTPPGLGWGKPLALLCFLSLRPEARRDEIVDLLWRDTDPAKARNTFRQALHRLRNALGEDLLPPDREWVRLRSSPRLWIDNAHFEIAAAAGRIEEALELYSGDFLEKTEIGEPPFDSWADRERTRLRARARQVLHDGVKRAAESGRWPQAIAYARRLLALAPFDAAAAELAATTLVSAGRRIEARELLQQFGQRLDAELGVPLPADLHALTSRLERQEGARTTDAAAMRGPDFLTFAGRETELSQLLALWRSTADDAGTLALVEGDPGLGKSRLVREVVGHARALGKTLVLIGRERAAGAQLPLGVFAEALRPLVRAPGISGASRHLLGEAARLLPELRDSFDLPAVDDVADDAARLRFYEGIAALLDAAAYEQRIMLVIEDAHAIAPSSLDLLSYLVARLAGSAVMFVITVRPLQTAATLLDRLRALARPTAAGFPPHGDRARLLTLAPLARDASRAAVDRPLAAAGVDIAAIDRVARQADGIPAALAELARRAASGDLPGEAPVPLRDLVAERLERMTSAQRRLLLVVAMIGRPISRESAAAAAHLSSGAAGEQIAELAREGLVELRDDGIVSTDTAAAVVLESAESPTRAFLAGWIAEALATSPVTSAAELSRFFAAAGQPREAFRHGRRAAFDALAVGAIQEGMHFLRSARAFAGSQDERDEIESYLTALGAGQRRIGRASARIAESAPPISVAEPAQPIDAALSRNRLEAVLPNWRFLVGGAVATLIIAAIVLAGPSALVPRVPITDTLVVSEGDAGDGARRYVTGDLASGFALSPRVHVEAPSPAWLDSLERPWTTAIAAPNGQYVAMSRNVPAGEEVHVITADRRDTVLIAAATDARAVSWSPDSRWVLVITSRSLADGTFDADLRGHRIGQTVAVPIDTMERRIVVEALWSPDGSRVAWVARAGDERQSEVFVGLSDGSAVENVSRHPADDHHIAWSGDGELLAFTSMRDGNAELYAYGVRDARLWRLTRDPAQDDRASFAPNERLVAFESTRGGIAGVYVMPALGGEAQRIGDLPLSVIDWRGGPARYLDRARVHVSSVPEPGDSAAISLVSLDQFDDTIAAPLVRWSVLNPEVATLAPSADSNASRRILVARRSGLARVVGAAGRWRADTALVRVGSDPVALLSSTGFADFARDWLLLGDPAPERAGDDAALSVNADREWDSGVLTRERIPLLPHLTLEATLIVPLRDAGNSASSANVSLVAPEDAGTLDRAAPHFLRYASFTWSAESDRFTYAVGREVHSEPAVAGRDGRIVVRLLVERDSTVSFSVNGSTRWRSSLRAVDARHDARVQAWIGGRATGDRVRLDDARLTLTRGVTP